MQSRLGLQKLVGECLHTLFTSISAQGSYLVDSICNSSGFDLRNTWRRFVAGRINSTLPLMSSGDGGRSNDGGIAAGVVATTSGRSGRSGRLKIMSN